MFFLVFLPAIVHSIIVETPLGLVKGAQFTARDHSLVHSFKHVPFTRPPLGELRFALPLPAEPWKGLRDGTKYGPACMSNSSTTTSPQKWVDEDCLHNNIFVSDRCLKSKKRCPVVFYIHGGYFNYDSAVMFPDEDMVNNFGAQDVVLVISAFRLGIFGLLTFDNDDVVARNIPVYDVIRSLQWVQDNIHAFGGDRKRVTIMGHSGGAAAVSALSFSKTIDPHRRLFHRGISMSGPALSMDDTLRRIKTWEFAQRAGCVPYPSFSIPSNNYIREAVECLRRVDGGHLLAVQRAMEDEGYDFNGLLLKPPLFPGGGVDDFMANPPKISMMMGSTWFEMDKWKSSDFSSTIAEMLGLKRPMAAARKYHRDVEKGKLDFNSTSETQSLFVGINCMAKEISRAGGEAYLYSYQYWRHAAHTDDLSYIMGVHKFKLDENEEVLAKIYPQYFINFIKTGRPDPEWKPFHTDFGNYFAINVDVKTGLKPTNALHYEKKVIDYWTKEMAAFDRSLPSSVEEKSALFPVLLLNGSFTPSVKNSTISVPFRYSWTTILFVLGLLLAGFLIGRLSRPLNRREHIVLDETTPLFKN